MKIQKIVSRWSFFFSFLFLRRKTNIFDNVVYMMEKYADNLEELVIERTGQLIEEKKKTDALLERMLPRWVHYTYLIRSWSSTWHWLTRWWSKYLFKLFRLDDALPFKGHTLVNISFIKYYGQKVFRIGFPLSSVFLVTMVACSGDDDEF